LAVTSKLALYDWKELCRPTQLLPLLSLLLLLSLLMASCSTPYQQDLWSHPTNRTIPRCKAAHKQQQANNIKSHLPNLRKSKKMELNGKQYTGVQFKFDI